MHPAARRLSRCFKRLAYYYPLHAIPLTDIIRREDLSSCLLISNRSLPWPRPAQLPSCTCSAHFLALFLTLTATTTNSGSSCLVRPSKPALRTSLPFWQSLHQIWQPYSITAGTSVYPPLPTPLIQLPSMVLQFEDDLLLSLPAHKGYLSGPLILPILSTYLGMRRMTSLAFSSLPQLWICPPCLRL